MTENYIDAHHTYEGAQNPQTGHRIRYTDVWFAHKPAVPQFAVIDEDGDEVQGVEVTTTTFWTLGKAGLGTQIVISDRDDIAGLRKLLDAIDQDFDRRDMEEMTMEFHEENAAQADTEPEDED